MSKNIRLEFKYLLNQQQARLIEEYIKKIGLQKDKHNSGSYTVTSLYFDTPTLRDYYEKQSGIKNRRKLRARIYDKNFTNKEAEVRLEIKRKYDMTVCKERNIISVNELPTFISGKLFANNLNKINNHKNFAFLFLSHGYRPNIVVRYKRKAYTGSFHSNYRITLDSNIEACKWKDFRYNINIVPVIRSKVILEIKFNSAIPWWFKDLVCRFNLNRQAFSKYTHGVDALNRYNRIAR